MLRARAAGRAVVIFALVAIVADPALAKCTLTRLVEWPVRLDRGHLMVDGAVNGQKIGVMLDTGADTFLFRSATQRLGLAHQDARGHRVFGIGGETYVEETMLEDVRIGELSRRNWRMLVAGERSFGNDVDLVLGEDFFEQADVEFDLPHGAVRLFRPEGCEGAALGYWASQGAGQVDLEPAYNVGQRIVVPVRINGRPLYALLDSGAGVSTLDKPVAERLGVKPDSPGVTFAGEGGGLGAKQVDSWIAPMQAFTIGDETISDTSLRFADLYKDARYTPIASHLSARIQNTPDMLLGADFLRAHRVLVSHSQRRMYFTYEGGPVFAPKGRDRAPPDPPR
jgi:predicted aspartyl protease